MNQIKTPALNPPPVIGQPQVGANLCADTESQAISTIAIESSAIAVDKSMAPINATNAASNGHTLTPCEALMYYERMVEQSLPQEDQRAAALLAIHDEGLYKLTHPSFADYLKNRWGLSRSRGYQLLHLARLNLGRAQAGEPPPANERQARQFAADGKRLPKGPGENSYAGRLRRVTRYLQANFANLPPAEHRRFLVDLRQALEKIELALQLQPPLQTRGSEFLKTEGSGCAAPSGSSSIQAPLPANPPASRPTPPLPTTGLVSRPGQSALQINTLLSKKQKTPTRQCNESHAQERPSPRGNTGSLLGLTMEEARRLGYV